MTRKQPAKPSKAQETPMESAAQSSGGVNFLELAMQAGLGPDDIQRIAGGDWSPIQKILPMLLSNPEARGLLTQLAAQQQPVASDAPPVASGGAETAQEDVGGAASFADQGDAFGRRLAAILGRRFGGAIRLNLQLDAQGLALQPFRFEETERNGKRSVQAVPYLEPIRVRPAQMGRAVRAMLRQVETALMEEAEDNAEFEDEDEPEDNDYLDDDGDYDDEE